jgi:hypothetical protein
MTLAHRPCGACRALVDVTVGCPHWRVGRPGGPGRPKGSRNKMTRGHAPDCSCSKCAARRVANAVAAFHRQMGRIQS